MRPRTRLRPAVSLALAWILVLALTLPITDTITASAAQTTRDPVLEVKTFLDPLMRERGENPAAWTEESKLAFLLEKNILTEPEVPAVRKGNLTRALVWRVWFHLLGYAPTAEEHPEIPAEPGLEGRTYINARTAAILSGAASRDTNSRSLMTEGEYAALLTQLHSAEFQALMREDAVLDSETFLDAALDELNLSPEGMTVEEKLELLVSHHMLTEPEVPAIRQGKLSRAIVWRVWYGKMGYLPAASAHSDIPDQIGLEGRPTYAAARVAAILTGQATVDTNACDTMRTREFEDLIRYLHSEEFRQLLGSDHDTDYAEALLSGIQKTSENARAYSLVQRTTASLPRKYLDEFLEKGWTLNLSNSPCPLHPSWNADTIAGVASVSTKEVYLYNARCDSGTWRHEFGHVVMYLTGSEAWLQALYERENSAATRALLGEYSGRNATEFFAETFEYWVTPGNSLASFQSIAPRTAAFVDRALIRADGLIDRELADAIVYGEIPPAL